MGRRRSLARALGLHRALAPLILIVVASTLSSPVLAATTVSVTDPVGDVKFEAPSYVDLVGAQVTGDESTFDFRLDVAGPIPNPLPLTPPGTNEVWWSFGISTDPGYPQGDPFPPTPAYPAASEFLASVIWDGTAFHARLLDRRPLLTGGDAVTTPLNFSISGSEVELSVSASQLGDPSSFGWAPTTVLWSSPPGATAGSHLADNLTPHYTSWP